jgi:phosphoserine phosphatase
MYKGGNASHGDWNVISRPVPFARIRLVVFDLDSTLIQQEVIDEMAALTGSEQVALEIKRITNESMQGTFVPDPGMTPFAHSLQHRVALFKGYSISWEQLAHRIIPARGADVFCASCRSQNVRTAICSGSFIPVVRQVQKILQIDHGYANELDFDAVSGALLGTVKQPIFGAESKRDTLTHLASEHQIPLSCVLAVGDGANDIPMLTLPGVTGIALNAKPLVQQHAPISITCDSMQCLYLFLEECDTTSPVSLPLSF